MPLPPLALDILRLCVVMCYDLLTFLIPFPHAITIFLFGLQLFDYDCILTINNLGCIFTMSIHRLPCEFSALTKTLQEAIEISN